MKNQFKIGDWVVCEHNRKIFRILHFCNGKKLYVLPDNCDDWGDIEEIEDCRLAREIEIKMEIARRKKNNVKIHYSYLN